MPRPLWLSSILPGYTIDITEKKLENDRVCSRHFLSGHPAKDWDRMDIDLIPTQNLGHSKRQQANQVNVERVQRRKRRQEAIQQKAMTTSVIECHVSQDGGLQHLDMEEEISLYQETQTETKDLSVLFPRHGEGEPLTNF